MQYISFKPCKRERCSILHVKFVANRKNIVGLQDFERKTPQQVRTNTNCQNRLSYFVLNRLRKYIELTKYLLPKSKFQNHWEKNAHERSESVHSKLPSHNLFSRIKFNSIVSNSMPSNSASPNWGAVPKFATNFLLAPPDLIISAITASYTWLH